MPHPLLQKWKKKGRFCIGLGDDGIYYCVPDIEGRESIHQLLKLFGQIEYESSVKFGLNHGPERLDANIEKRNPKWFVEDLKITGSPESLKMELRNTTFSFDQTELTQIFSRPHHGYEEVYLETPHTFAIF